MLPETRRPRRPQKRTRTAPRPGTALLALLALALALSPGRPARGAESGPPPSYVREQVLERPVPLRRDIGNSHETVTTASPDAQRYYDQGLNYLESFAWIEAARSFHQALRLDPNLALAHVGLSYAHSGFENTEGAKYYLRRAKALAAGDGPAARITDHERRRIEIRERQIVAMDDLSNRGKREAYRKAIDEALAAHPDDPVFWLLRGTASEPYASGQGQRGGAASLPYYRHVLNLVPDDASAHHYLAHTFEAMGPPDSAVAHAGAYLRLASSVPHAAHMMGHAFRRAGRIDEAIAQFQRSDSLERAYFAAEGINPSSDWHHAHNLQLLATSYQQIGRVDLAERALRELATLGAGDADRAFNRKELPNFLIHRGRYQEALEEAEGMAQTRYPQSRSVGHALAGRALLGLGRIGAAGRELDAAERELTIVPRSVLPLEPSKSQVEPWVKELRSAYSKAAGPATSIAAPTQDPRARAASRCCT